MLFYTLGETIERVRQIAGYNEEVLDLCYVVEDTHLAVASNSEQVVVI
jgi:U3 small nucleolar RNA-associated protein 13